MYVRSNHKKLYMGIGDGVWTREHMHFKFFSMEVKKYQYIKRLKRIFESKYFFFKSLSPLFSSLVQCLPPLFSSLSKLPTYQVPSIPLCFILRSTQDSASAVVHLGTVCRCGLKSTPKYSINMKPYPTISLYEKKRRTVQWSKEKGQLYKDRQLSTKHYT